MKKIRIKKRIKKKNKYVILFLFIMAFTLFLLILISKKTTPILIESAKKKSKTISNNIITKSVNDNVLKDMNKEEIFIEKRDNNGNVITTDFNSVILNQILNKITVSVEKDLRELNNKVSYRIPIGIIFNSSLLSNLGPKIPVKINLDGDVITSLNTEVKDYGINNALIKISVNVKVYMNVIIPFKTEEIIIETNIPIVMRIVEGEIPSYYYPINN